LDKQPETILIDKTSLELFVDSSSIVHKIGSEIAKRSGIDYETGTPFIGSDYVKNLYFCNIRTIDELNKSLEENEELIIRFASAVITSPSDRPTSGSFVTKSIALYYLCYILVLKQNKTGLLKQYIDEYTHVQKERLNPWVRKLTSIFKTL
jgi:hypothetical protein